MWQSIGKWIMNNPEWVAFVIYSVIEHFIGKSKKIKSNSILELLWAILTLVIKKRK